VLEVVQRLCGSAFVGAALAAIDLAACIELSEAVMVFIAAKAAPTKRLGY